MKKILVLAALLVAGPWRPAAAFDLWSDVKAQTQWTLGSSVAAGSAVAFRSDESLGVKGGQFIGSALAQIASYRMFSVWAGGNFIPQADHSLKAIETGKVGLNLGYFLQGFTNKPPDVLSNLVVGPSLMMPLWTTPHVVVPFLDINYRFGAVDKPAQ